MAVPNHVLIDIGSRWSSSLVLAEAELALHRWREDVEHLKPFGWGESRRLRFEALVDQLRARHDAWTHAQFAAGSLPAHEDVPPSPDESTRRDRAAARRWLDRAISILEAAEIEHAEAATALAAIPPPGEGATTLLDAVREALRQCMALRPRLDPEAAEDAFYAEGASVGATLAGALNQNPTDALDRAEVLETLDGEVYLTIRGLNRAAQRAFLGDFKGRADRYVFQFLVTIARGDEEITPKRSDPPPHRSDTPAHRSEPPPRS
jgi:hypothetical protein